jgi:hypothetical protein
MRILAILRPACTSGVVWVVQLRIWVVLHRTHSTMTHSIMAPTPCIMGVRGRRRITMQMGLLLLTIMGRMVCIMAPTARRRTTMQRALHLITMGMVAHRIMAHHMGLLDICTEGPWAEEARLRWMDRMETGHQATMDQEAISTAAARPMHKTTRRQWLCMGRRLMEEVPMGAAGMGLDLVVTALAVTALAPVALDPAHLAALRRVQVLPIWVRAANGFIQCLKLNLEMLAPS